MFNFFDDLEEGKEEGFMAQVHAPVNGKSKAPCFVHVPESKMLERIYIEGDEDDVSWEDGEAPFIIATKLWMEHGVHGPDKVSDEPPRKGEHGYAKHRLGLEIAAPLYYRASKNNYVATFTEDHIGHWGLGKEGFIYEAIIELAAPIIHCGAWTEDMEGLEPWQRNRTELQSRVLKWLTRAVRDSIETAHHILKPGEVAASGLYVWGEYQDVYDSPQDVYPDMGRVVPTAEWVDKAQALIREDHLDDFLYWLDVDEEVPQEGSSDYDLWRAWDVWRGFPVELYMGISEDH